MENTYSSTQGCGSDWFAQSGLSEIPDWNAERYAQRLVRYISDPSTVRARTLDQYGKAPSKDQIRAYRANWLRTVAERKATRDYPDADYTNDPGYYRPEGIRTGIVASKRAAQPKSTRPKPQPVVVSAPQSVAIPDAPPPVRLVNSAGLQTGADVIGAVAQWFGIGREDIIGNGRFRRYARPRQLTAAILRARGGSYCNIGLRLARDHSSIMHAMDVFFDTLIHIPEYERAWMALAPCVTKMARSVAELDLMIVRRV